MHANALIEQLERMPRDGAQNPPSKLRAFGHAYNQGWRRWVFGGAGIFIWTAIAAVAKLLEIPDPPVTPASAWHLLNSGLVFWLSLSSAVLACFAAFVSDQSAKWSEDQRVRAENDRLWLARRGVQRWLDCCQGRFSHGDYRITLLLCRRHPDGKLTLDPVLRDRNHQISPTCKKCRVDDADASLCEGVAGNAWRQRAPVEAATQHDFDKDPQAYAKDLSISVEFARECSRASRYYLGIPLMHNNHPIAVVTIDTKDFGCLVKLREPCTTLKNAHQKRHKAKLQEIEQQKDYIFESLIHELFIAGGLHVD